MKKYAFLALFLFFLGCNATGGTETGNPTDSVALAISNSIDVLSSSVSADAGTLSALTLADTPSALRGSNDSGSGSSGSGRSCDDDAEIEVDIECVESSHDASIIRNFGTGCEAGTGITLTGDFYSSWTNLGTGACANSTSRPQLFEAVQGTNTRQIVSTGPIGSDTCSAPATSVTQTFANGSTRIRSCRRFDYSGHSSSGGVESFQEQLTINEENRVRLKASGETLFDHTISTPSPLIFSVTKRSGDLLPARHLSSGTVRVVHNIAGYTVTSTFSNLEYNYTTCRCHPVSGSVDVSVTDTTSGDVLGTGHVSFTESTTGVCDTTTSTYNDSRLPLILGSCRGF